MVAYFLTDISVVFDQTYRNSIFSGKNYNIVPVAFIFQN